MKNIKYFFKKSMRLIKHYQILMKKLGMINIGKNIWILNKKIIALKDSVLKLMIFWVKNVSNKKIMKKPKNNFIRFIIRFFEIFLFKKNKAEYKMIMKKRVIYLLLGLAIKIYLLIKWINSMNIGRYLILVKLLVGLIFGMKKKVKIAKK